MPAPVVVDDLAKRYGDRFAVDGVGLSVGAGEVLALLGPNGAGKTTTVECVAGLRTPDRGRVRVLGADPRAERDRVTPGLGMMLQEGGLHRSATPAELLRSFAAYHDTPIDPAHLLGRLGLEAVSRRRVRTLSGGERQRVSLALALVGRPRVALLDEPTAGMDPQARRDTWALVEELRCDGAAVLLTTHAMEEAERLADRVAVIDAGRLLALDRPAALAGRRPGLLVDSGAALDRAGLVEALGAPVAWVGEGRWHVDVDVDRLPEVVALCAARGLPITGITADHERLEDVYLRLTDRRAAS